MNAIVMRRIVGVLMVALGAAISGCGEYVRDQGRAPAQVVVNSLQAASGATPGSFSTQLFSDVVTKDTIYADNGQVTMTLILKDQGVTGSASPSTLNQVTFSRYHVVYRRADGRNTPGVDVPFAFDAAATFTVPPSGSATFGFELVRHDAKLEAPLLALRNSAAIIGTFADVTFYGRDQTGNDVAVTATIQIEFGNFGDPS